MNGSGGKRIAILVAGMHRSGTSALARVLNIAGCDLPRTLMKPQRDNTAGFWESQAIMDLNEEILASAGSSWDDWRPFDRGWYASPLAEGFRERALELLQNEFGGSRLFVLKDPRICRLLEFWSEATGAFGARPLVVSPLRSPFDVASSLHARNGIDPFVGHLIWLRHVLDAEAASRSLKRSYLRYEQLLSQAQALIDRLGEDLDISWPKRQSPFAEMEVDEFLSPALRHHHSEDAGHRSNPRLSHWITASFDIFDRWSRGDARKEDMPDLDRIRAAFDEAAPAFSRALAAGRTADQKNRLLTSELEASRSEVDALIRELESARHLAKERKDRIDVLWKEREGFRLSAKERKDRIGALWKEREGARHLAKERKDRIDALWKEREGARHLAKERKDRIDALWKEREGFRLSAKERKDRIGALTRELETARMGHVMAFAQRGARFGIEELEVGVLLNPEWVEQAGQRRDRGPALDLRRNGRLVARAFTRDLSHNVVRFAAGLRLPAVGCALYSLHDARSGEVLAALAAVAWREARRVVGAVESRPQPEVRGWALDPGDPGRSRRVALHVDGHLRKVVTAAERRADIARWQGIEGRHGFRWCIPEGGAVKDGTRIEVFDADTGRRLRGSPLRIEGGRAINSTRRGA